MENWDIDIERFERQSNWNQSYDDCGVYTCADDYKEGE